MLRDVSAPLPEAKGLAGPRERLCQFAHGILIFKRLIKVILLLSLSLEAALLQTSLSTHRVNVGERRNHFWVQSTARL